MKTTSPKQEMAWSLTELSLLDQIHIRFWALHQTESCNYHLTSHGKDINILNKWLQNLVELT